MRILPTLKEAKPKAQKADMPDAKPDRQMEGYIFSHVRHKLGQKEWDSATIRHYKF